MLIYQPLPKIFESLKTQLFVYTDNNTQKSWVTSYKTTASEKKLRKLHQQHQQLTHSTMFPPPLAILFCQRPAVFIYDPNMTLRFSQQRRRYFLTSHEKLTPVQRVYLRGRTTPKAQLSPTFTVQWPHLSNLPEELTPSTYLDRGGKIPIIHRHFPVCIL